MTFFKQCIQSAPVGFIAMAFGLIAMAMALACQATSMPTIELAETIASENHMLQDDKSKPNGSSNKETGKTEPTKNTVRIGKIDWYVDYDAALTIAKSTGKPIWLHFGENPG